MSGFAMELMLAPAGSGAPLGSRKANLRDTRHHNLRLVLGTLYREGELSRADIGRRTLLTKVAVSDLVAELLTEGIVEEVGRRSPTGRGKPATFLQVRPSGRSVVAVDLSGVDRVRCALVDLQGRVLAEYVRAADGPLSVEDVVEVSRHMVAASAAPVLGVAIGTPGTVSAQGAVLSAPRLGWADVPLRERVEAALSLPVVVENDANAAVLAERTFAGGARDMLLVQMALGVGAGVLLNDAIVRGASSAAGEIGHVVVDPEGPICPCGKRGCLETVLSSAVLRSADHRDPLVHAGERLAAALAPVVAMLDVPEIVVMGHPDRTGRDLLDALAEGVRARTASGFRRDVLVRRSSLGVDAVLRGVSALLLRERLAAF